MMSVGFLLSSPSDAVIWRGPKKNGESAIFSDPFLSLISSTSLFSISTSTPLSCSSLLSIYLSPSLPLPSSPLPPGLIKQFLRDVDWGDVDYLVIDTPPGTSDEHISVVQYLSGAGVDGAVLVTTPQVYIIYTLIYDF